MRITALALLKKAEQVTVCEVAPEDNLAAVRSHLAEVVGWLQRNDIPAAPVAMLSTGDDATSLNIAANDRNVSIIVAGAYEHRKIRERILGGITENLLRDSRRCLFLSH